MEMHEPEYPQRRPRRREIEEPIKQPEPQKIPVAPPVPTTPEIVPEKTPEKISSWIIEAEGLAGSNDELYLDPMFTSDGSSGPKPHDIPLTDQGTSTESLTASLKFADVDSLPVMQNGAINPGIGESNDPSKSSIDVTGETLKQNAMNPAVNSMAPEGNENIIMNGSKSIDYLEMITKEASDSDIYYKGFEDGKADREMDKALANLSDDYFHGWQDGQIYQHAPVEENVSHQPQKRSLPMVDMKPGSNALPDLQNGYELNKSKVTASVDLECGECGSIRVAHCGAEECNDNNGVNAQSVVPPTDDKLSETLNTNENIFPVVASTNCKNCYGSGIVCRDCGCAR